RLWLLQTWQVLPLKWELGTGGADRSPCRASCALPRANEAVIDTRPFDRKPKPPRVWSQRQRQCSNRQVHRRQICSLPPDSEQATQELRSCPVLREGPSVALGIPLASSQTSPRPPK